MKYLIAADIHGSAFYCEQLIKQFKASGADKLILLGDLLYHGPRNELPFGYEPKKVINMLNSISDKIFCIRGNCDCDVDQAVLRFPIMAEYAMIPYMDKTIFITHGHKYGRDAVEKYMKAAELCAQAKAEGKSFVEPEPIYPLQSGDVLLQGHTHVSICTEFANGIININPGSVSIPRGGSSNGYLIYENGLFTRYSLTGMPEFKYEMTPKVKPAEDTAAAADTVAEVAADSSNS